MSDRIETIRKMLAEQGEEVFLVYSLGMELASAGRFDAAAEQFRRCMELDTTYLPAYSEAGKALRAAGRLAEARDAFAAGMHLAEQARDTHLRDHLQAQLDALRPGDARP